MKLYRTFKKPKIVIAKKAMDKMNALIAVSKDEIGWHGLVQRDLKKNEYYVYDIIVYPQAVTGSSINPDQKKFEKLLDIYRKNFNFPFNEIRLHGHSHVNMHVFSSATDTKFQEDLLANVKKDDYYIFLIMNKKGDLLPILYDRAHELYFEKTDIDIEIETEVSKVEKWALIEIAQKITKDRPIMTKETTPTTQKPENYEQMTSYQQYILNTKGRLYEPK